MRALEAATLLAIRKSLRSGSVWVDHSENFRGRESLLISRERWEAERNRRYDQLRVPQRPDDRLNAMLNALSEKLERVDKAVRDGEITIDDQVHFCPASRHCRHSLR